MGNKNSTSIFSDNDLNNNNFSIENCEEDKAEPSKVEKLMSSITQDITQNFRNTTHQDLVNKKLKDLFEKYSTKISEDDFAEILPEFIKLWQRMDLIDTKTDEKNLKNALLDLELSFDSINYQSNVTNAKDEIIFRVKMHSLCRKHQNASSAKYEIVDAMYGLYSRNYQRFSRIEFNKLANDILSELAGYEPKNLKRAMQVVIKSAEIILKDQGRLSSVESFVKALKQKKAALEEKERLLQLADRVTYSVLTSQEVKNLINELCSLDDKYRDYDKVNFGITEKADLQRLNRLVGCYEDAKIEREGQEEKVIVFMALASFVSSEYCRFFDLEEKEEIISSKYDNYTNSGIDLSKLDENLKIQLESFAKRVEPAKFEYKYSPEKTEKSSAVQNMRHVEILTDFYKDCIAKQGSESLEKLFFDTYPVIQKEIANEISPSEILTHMNEPKTVELEEFGVNGPTMARTQTMMI